MKKTLMIDVVMQQLEALSIEELLDVRAKVDALIQNKISSVYQNQSGFGSIPTAMCYIGKAQPISANFSFTPTAIYYQGKAQPISADIGMPFEIKPVSSPKQENNNSLEKIIELVDEWMADESDYDQETYSQIEASVNKHRVSL